MQHSGTCTTTMEIDKNEGKLTPPTSRGRHNHKLKVLVRSHAMRESTSPPREPSPNFLISPCINVIPSSEPSPTIINSSSVSSPLVALSPSISRVTSPSRTPICVSPTSTLVPSPNARSSPLSASPHHQVIENHEETDDDGGGVYLNRLNKQNLERDSKKDDASHVNLKKKYICDCSNQNCIKCTKEEEGNINNNLTNVNNNVVGTSNTLTVNRGGSKGKLKQQGSSQGSFEGSSSNSPCLSRDSSCEQQYTDTSGIDLEQFIADTVNRSQKDRNLLLRIEQDLVNFAKDINKTHYKFPPMSSYQRMLVHRVAAFFGMEHNIEATGKCVVVNKTKNTRIPEIPFRAHIKDDGFFSDEPKRSILKRDSNSAEDCFKLIDRQFNMENRRSKSFEEREEEYERARRRIFNREFISGLGENMPQSQFPVYGQGFPPPAHDSVPLYQQPCFVYANPYGVPVSQHFENRMEQPLPPEMSAAYYMSIPENGAPPASQAMAYQQPPAYWNQQPLAYYQNTSSNPTPPQRFSLPMHPQGQPGYVPAPYHQNFLAPANQPPPPPNPDLLPVYPQQQMQVVYSAQPNQSNPVMYPNQPNLVYTQNPVYTNSIYPPANMPQYPQNTSTPNSCTSSASHATFTGHIQDQNHQNVMQLTQNMAQMSFVQNQVPTQSNFVNRPVPSHYDIRQKSYTPKGNKFNGPKPFILNSSQSSTGTNSPAATVVAGYGPPHPNMYRTPPETPPHQFGYGHNFTVPPMFFRQMSNVRATTPGTNRSSRSPTPASEVAHFDKQRIQLPTAVYHGTPYVLQSEGRISGRGQPSAYRHPPPPRQQSFAPTPENRSHKNRKSKGNKMSGPPPNGNPV